MIKKIQYCIAILLAMASPLLSVTNFYILKNPKSDQRVLIIGNVHTYSNPDADKIMNDIKQQMGQKIVTQLKKFKNQNPNIPLITYYELDDSGVDVQDVIIEEFHKQKSDTIKPYDPRSHWSVALEAYRQVSDKYPLITKNLLNKLKQSGPTIEEVLKQLKEEYSMITAWNIGKEKKDNLLLENKALQAKLEKIKSLHFSEAFFEKNMKEELLAYDYKLADLGYYQKVIEDNKKNIILVVGQLHANANKKMLLEDGFELEAETNQILPKAGTTILEPAFISLLKNSSNDIEKGINKFLLKLAKTCKICFKQGNEESKLLRCTRCKQAHYCTAACQRIDWPAHKKECKKICEKTKKK